MNKSSFEYEIDKKDSLGKIQFMLEFLKGDEPCKPQGIMNINKDIVYFGRACVEEISRGKGSRKLLL